MSTRRTPTGDTPLFAWGDALRAAKRRTRARRFATGVAFSAVALIATAIVPPTPRLVWNVSASAPTGLYWIEPDASVDVGDMVVARLAGPWREFASVRHYLPANVPLVKRVAAIAGSTVCAHENAIFVDGKRVAMRLGHDAHGRTMPRWTGCHRLSPHQVLLLTPAPDSFDGRYFGATDGADLIGRARLLWRR